MLPAARAPSWTVPMVAAAAAATLPSLLAYNVSPSATFLNQALALGLWGLFAMVLGVMIRLPPALRRTRAVALLAPGTVFALLSGATLASPLWGSLPWTLALSVLGSLAAAAVLAVAGAQAGCADDGTARRLFAAFCAAWVIAALLNAAIAMLQTFAPQACDGVWVACTTLAGRAVGNLRQPNHLSTLLLWGAIAAVALLDTGRLRRRVAWPALGLIVFALVLTASRTAVLGVLLLAAWGLADRRLQAGTRVVLLATPLLYAAGWLAMAARSRLSQQAFGGVQRLAEADLSASRFGIWSDALHLIRQHPWGGVGVGEFNFAWSLSILPDRPVAFFDHAHNLLLHWAVELGVPLAGLLTALLAWALWRIARAGAAPEAAASTLPARAGLVMLLLIGLHSQLEYPLWYAYFLLPTAWLLGYGCARAATVTRNPTSRPEPQPAAAPARPVRAAPAVPHPGPAGLALAGLVLAVAAVAAVVDYTRVAAVFDDRSAVPLAERIDRGRRSILFGHHADYTAATISSQPEREMDALRRAAHYLLDTRLMMAWAEAHARSGDLPRARYLAERLREFRHPDSRPLFQACPGQRGAPAAVPASAGAPPLPYPCQGPDPRVTLRWSDFR